MLNLYTESRLIHFASRNLKARIASTRGRRKKGRTNVAKQKATARVTARTAKPIVNPRSSAGQAGARRPTTTAQKTTSERAFRIRTPETNVQTNANTTVGGATPMPQPERDVARQGFIDSFSGNEVVSDTKRLQEMFDAGSITLEQQAAARAQLINGYKGVDPLGFGGEGANRDAQGNLVIQGGNTSQGNTQRAPAGAPLEDPRSGAGGQLGELGISEGTFSGQIRDLTARRNEIMMVRTGSGQSVVDTEGMKFRNENIDAEIRQIERQIKDEQASEAQAEAARAETRKDEVVTTPESAGAGAAFANLPPEAQFLAPFFQEFQQSMQQSLQENAQMTQGLLDKQTSSADAIDSQLSDMQQAYKTSAEAMQGILEDVTEQTDKNIAKQEKAEEERITWQEMKLRRDITKQKREAHDTLIAQIALNNGFAQDAGTTAVLKSDAEFDSRMQELSETMTFARTDLAAKFSGLYMENQNNYVNATKSNTKDLLSSMERLGMAGIQNQQAKQTAEQNLLTSAWERQVGLRNTLAKGNLDIAKDIQGVIKDAKTEARQSEEDALERIDYLLNNYPRESVAEAIKELGKNVKSFDVQALIDNPTLDEIEKAKSAMSGGGGYISGFFPQGQPNAPAITYDEFINQKINEKEQEQGMSLNPDARQEYIDSNNAYFETQYDQLTNPNFKNITSGNPQLDAAVDAYMRNDLTVSAAAKAYNVSQADIATQAGIVREKGSQNGDVRALQKEQQNELTKLRSAIDKNPISKALGVMDLAIPKMQVGRESLTGVGDVALMNFYQNGIVDPGLAVRADDVALLRQASAWRDKITPDFVLSVYNDGAFFPDESRVEMLRIAKEVYAMTQRLYQDEVYNPVIEQASFSGIGEPYFAYKSRKQEAQAGSPADDYITSQGF